jgi:hypothetical protein
MVTVLLFSPVLISAISAQRIRRFLPGQEIWFHSIRRYDDCLWKIEKKHGRKGSEE